MDGTGRMGLGEDGDGEGEARDEQQKIPRPRLTGVKFHEGAIEQGGAASAPLANGREADGQVINGAWVCRAGGRRRRGRD